MDFVIVPSADKYYGHLPEYDQRYDRWPSLFPETETY